MDDLIKSLKAYLYDKFTSPLSGAFILSWVFWNWEIVLLVISDSYIYDKLFQLNELIEKAKYQNLIINPAMSTLIIIVIYPLLSSGAYAVSRAHQKLFDFIKNYFDDITPLSKAESILLRREMRKKEEEFEAEIGKLQQKIQMLEQKDPDIQKKNMEQIWSVNTSEFVENKSPKETYRILKLVNDKPNELKIKVIEKVITEISMTKLEAEVIIDELVKRDFINEVKNMSDLTNDPFSEGMIRLSLTKSGKSLLLKIEKNNSK